MSVKHRRAPHFSSSVYQQRIDAVKKISAQTGIDAVIVTPGADFAYLLGSRLSSHERLTALVVPSRGAEVTVIVPKLERSSLATSAVPTLGLNVVEWVDGEDPYQAVLISISGGTTEEGAPNSFSFAISEGTPALHLLPLAGQAGTLPILATPILRRLRMIKSPDEREALCRAGNAIDQVHARMAEFLAVGRTERQVGLLIEEAMLEEGHEYADFIIVGSGPNGANPHHEVSDRVIQLNDIVVVDIGGMVEPGYFSDSTRTYCLGTPSLQQRESIAVLKRAQQAAVQAVRPGVTAEFIDSVARSILADAGLSQEFTHRTGHGIGLSVHEEPFIVQGNATELEAGMAFSIEPGIYFDGEWGARIEDIVVVTDQGCEPLNNRPHGLTII